MQRLVALISTLLLKVLFWKRKRRKSAGQTASPLVAHPSALTKSPEKSIILNLDDFRPKQTVTRLAPARRHHHH